MSANSMTVDGGVTASRDEVMESTYYELLRFRM